MFDSVIAIRNLRFENEITSVAITVISKLPFLFALLNSPAISISSGEDMLSSFEIWDAQIPLLPPVM